MVEDVRREFINIVAEQAAFLPNRGNARKPDDHEEACEIDGDGNAIVVGTENADGEVNEERRNKIGCETDTLEHVFMDFV